jgi:hypothetical protein
MRVTSIACFSFTRVHVHRLLAGHGALETIVFVFCGILNTSFVYIFILNFIKVNTMEAMISLMLVTVSNCEFSIHRELLPFHFQIS